MKMGAQGAGCVGGARTESAPYLKKSAAPSEPREETRKNLRLPAPLLRRRLQSRQVGLGFDGAQLEFGGMIGRLLQLGLQLSRVGLRFL